MRLFSCCDAHGGLPVICLVDDEAFVGQVALEDFDDLRLVIDEQH